MFNFRKAEQASGETIHQFCARLKQLSVHCEFTDVQRELKAQIELSTDNNSLRKYAFRKPELTLDEP